MKGSNIQKHQSIHNPLKYFLEFAELASFSVQALLGVDILEIRHHLSNMHIDIKVQKKAVHTS